MGNLSALQHYHSSSSAAASPNPGSPVSDHVRDPGHVPDGYLSDDPAHGSGNRRGERKKGVPWTEEEHRLFLIGLKKLGKGDWRGIARNYVVSRTPTQVASHAQKYFIRQSNASRRKRRSSLFDMDAEMVKAPEPVPEEQELPSTQTRDIDAPKFPSLNISLNPEDGPMESSYQELSKESEDTLMESAEVKPTVPGSSELTPVVSRPSEFIPVIPGITEGSLYVPGFFPAFVPIPYPFWPPNAADLVEEEKSVEPSHHQVLRPVPILPKEPVNVDELVGMSHLNLGENGTRHQEPSPLSLKLVDESRQSAFHANAPPRGSNLGEGKGNPIQAV